MNWKTILKVGLLISPTLIVLNHDFYTISNLYSARVRGSSLSPVFNPLHNTSSGIIEDDYVLIKILGSSFDPNTIKDKFVRVVNPDGSKSIKKVECIEGEWCPSPFGFTFIQSGHAWLKTNDDPGSPVTPKQTPLSSIDGQVQKIIWPPDRQQAFNPHKNSKILNKNL